MKSFADHSPKVCVGIPVFNGGLYLREALDSLLRQDCKEFDVVIVNDGSTDSSDSIVREFVARDRRVHYFHRTERRGMIATWKEAFDRAWGLFAPDYFAWHGDHDKVAPDWLSSLVAAMDLTPELSCAYARTVCLSTQGSVSFPRHIVFTPGVGQ
jgi:glycosyltransferase involved in cell wall biosynthesis